MSYSITIFKNIFDTKTSRRVNLDTWTEFENLMYNLSTKPGYKPKKDEKFNPNSSLLISPAMFQTGTTRANKNVTHWSSLAIMDVDDYPGTFEDALSVFDEHKCICYSSASSTKEKPKFRIIFPLSRDIKKEEIKHFWYALNKEFNSLGDPQTKDLSRMYYVPAQYPNAFNFIIFNRNKPELEVESLLTKYPFSTPNPNNTFLDNLPDEVRKQLLDYRKTRLTNTSIKWTGINDCPFINKKLVNEYRSITETGWYHKMYQILLSCASNAIRRGYPIDAKEIAALGRELDSSTGGWYNDRPLESEAERAICYAFQNQKA